MKRRGRNPSVYAATRGLDGPAPLKPPKCSAPDCHRLDLEDVARQKWCAAHAATVLEDVARMAAARQAAGLPLNAEAAYALARHPAPRSGLTGGDLALEARR